jgi:cysteine-rich repeat protein
MNNNNAPPRNDRRLKQVNNFPGEKVMKKLTLFTLLVSVLFAFGAPNAFAGAAKVSVCHVPPDSPDNVKILEVGAAAALKHIERHGDYLLPADEVCDYKDNNCNREVDEGYDGLGAACSEGIGACNVTGSIVCAQDGLGSVCDAIADEPGEEAGHCSDGIDNNCDGTTDCGDAACSLDPACKIPACGDGFVDVNETCDDGNEYNGDGCGATCQYEPEGSACFGGVFDTVDQCQQYTVNANHECELGDRPDGDLCQGNGVDACTSADTCQSGVCQDNGPNAAPEICDNGIDDNCSDGPDCADPACGGDPACAPSAVCGNGIIEEGEECDGENLGVASCQSEGFFGGALACGASCSFVTTGCYSLCSGDTQMCPGGVLVDRDPFNSCSFCPCPQPNVLSPPCPRGIIDIPQ